MAEARIKARMRPLRKGFSQFGEKKTQIAPARVRERLILYFEKPDSSVKPLITNPSMEAKKYLTPGMRIIPMQFLEAFCVSDGNGMEGGVPDYEPIEGFEW